MGKSWSLRVLILVPLFSSIFCQLTRAQDSVDYDSAYDDLEAAGDQGYSDQNTADAYDLEAAGENDVGDSKESEDEAAPAWEWDSDWEEGSEQEGPDPRDGLKPWEWAGPRHHSNLGGPTGLLHIAEAGSAEPGTFGIGLHGGYFYYESYFYYDDTNTAMWADLHLRVTPLKFLEVFAGLNSRANYNTAVRPELFQALGDFKLGVKGYYSPFDWLTVGGLLAWEFMNPVGEIDFSFKGSSFPLGLLTTFDFAEFNIKIPIRAHLNFIYHFDNAYKLVEEIEWKRGGCDQDVDGDGEPNYDGCLNPVERTALGIDRLDQFRIGLGVDVAFPYVTPMLEYVLEIPVNRQDFNCPEQNADTSDSCMAIEGSSGMRQWMTIGVRVLPPLDSLAIDIGVDFGFSGYAPAVQELGAQPPYQILFGLSYNFDPFPEKEIVKESAPQELPAPKEEKPIILGRVVDADNQEKVIFGASITYIGMEVNPQLSDNNGSFRSYPMSPGEVTLEVAAPGYQTAVFTVNVPDPMAPPPMDTDTEGTEAEPTEDVVPPAMEPLAEEDQNAPEDGSAPATAPAAPGSQMENMNNLEIPLVCPLKALPQKALIMLTVVDQSQKPVPEANVSVNGPVRSLGSTDANGQFITEVDSGTYSITVDKDGYSSATTSTDAEVGKTSKLEVRLSDKSEKPKSTQVIVHKKRIVIKKAIHFKTGSGEIESSSFDLLGEIADVIKEHPDIRLIEIQGHTDNRGGRMRNVKLSKQRAESVMEYLIQSGVESSRLRAKGFGPDRPLAPNMTSMGRARNRRVEFHIIERDK
jgi:outer membrane protein OmpA-like peptidoglycan-associated protein